MRLSRIVGRDYEAAADVDGTTSERAAPRTDSRPGSNSVRLFALIFLGLQLGLLAAPAAWAQVESHLGDPDAAPLPKNITTLLDSRRHMAKTPSTDQLLDTLFKLDKKLTGFDPTKSIDPNRMNELLEKYQFLKDPQTARQP